MALGTGHIHLLDTESFSDYGPPIELSGFGRAGAAEELFERADSETTEISGRGKTESASAPFCCNYLIILGSSVQSPVPDGRPGFGL